MPGLVSREVRGYQRGSSEEDRELHLSALQETDARCDQGETTHREGIGRVDSHCQAVTGKQS